MYIEFLIEDASGKIMLEALIPKIAPQLTIKAGSCSLHQHKGLSHLLKRLPGRLASFATTYSYDKEAHIFIICDLDNKDKKLFEEELNGIATKCGAKDKTIICLAIEEMEAWLLGDVVAIKRAYKIINPKAITSYKNDSICGTWEKLADAIYKGGSAALRGANPGAQKCEWAKKIADCMDNVDNNSSPSFCHFRDTLRNAVNAAAPASG